MKKAILVISLFVFFMIINRELLNAQDFDNLAKKSKISLNGLEMSDYKKVRIMIEIQDKASKIGLTEERVRTRCESRLRQAGLQPVVSKDLKDLFDRLVIRIHVISNAFAVDTRFNRAILFEVEGTPYSMVAPTWYHSGTGTHSGNPEYIIQVLDQTLDLFLTDYLKANVK